MTASAPVGQMSKSTTDVPAGRLNSEPDAGEGVTLSSTVVKDEDAAGACAYKVRAGRLRKIANARVCAGFIRASGGTPVILEHATRVSDKKTPGVRHHPKTGEKLSVPRIAPEISQHGESMHAGAIRPSKSTLTERALSFNLW
jgi:hypothetical protein